MKIIILGMARSGKDTMCLHLEEQYGLSWVASSMFACRTFLFEQMRTEYGYASVQECYDDRGSHRATWYEAIRDYNQQDRTRLGRGIFEANDVYCGIRDDEEFYALKAQGAFSLAIWIDASARKPPEDSSSMTLSEKDADITISNNGTEAEFIRRIEALFNSLKLN